MTKPINQWRAISAAAYGDSRRLEGLSVQYAEELLARIGVSTTIQWGNVKPGQAYYDKPPVLLRTTDGFVSRVLVIQIDEENNVSVNLPFSVHTTPSGVAAQLAESDMDYPMTSVEQREKFYAEAIQEIESRLRKLVGLPR